MKIKTGSFLSSAGVILLILVTLISLALANILFSSVRDIQKNNDTLLQLAVELRRSSQALTENVRLYVNTADIAYKNKFKEIADIREGRKPRSNIAKVAPSQQISLLYLITQHGVTEEEFAYLKTANDLSNALIEVEQRAMEVIEAHNQTNDKENENVNDLKRQKAISLIVSNEYQAEVTKIQHEIDKFLEKLTTRTHKAYEEAQHQFAIKIFVALMCLICTLFFAIFASWFIYRRVIAPLEETTNFAKKTAEGNLDNQISITHMDELGVLRQSLNTLIVNLNNINPTTGLYRFQKFLDETRAFIKNNPDADLRIVTIDIDNFNYINEVFGFEVGSHVLQEFALHLKRNLSDNYPMGSYDGDTFSITSYKHSLTADDIKTKLHLADFIRTLEPILGKHANLSLSIGVYDIIDKELDVVSILDCAHIACLKSKDTYGTHIEFFTEEMRQENINQKEMLKHIQNALLEKEFELFYQPKFDIEKMHVVGAEALIRWFKDGKMIPPDEFIPIAERHGLISELDYHVIELACQFIRLHKHDCLPHISINISGFTIIKRELVDKLIAITNAYNVKPEELDIEITETALVHNFDMAIKQILALRDLGFTISMDDFGTGVSSLNRLSQMPLDTIKLDRVFIMDALENKKSSVIVQTVIDLAKNIGAKTVAEGIETKEQLDLLRSLSCEHGQGYFYARPMSKDTFLKYLTEEACPED